MGLPFMGLQCLPMVHTWVVRGFTMVAHRSRLKGSYGFGLTVLAMGAHPRVSATGP